MDYEVDGDVPRTENDYLNCVSIVLDQIIEMQKPKKGKITNFHASKVPAISVKQYVERIGKYIGCSNECYVLLIIYVDRIIKLHTDITLSLLCIHRIIITAAMIAAKFFDDVYYSNAFYAKIGGVTTEEINELEIYFLNLLDYRLYVSAQEYEFYRKYISLAVRRFLEKHEQKKKKTPVARPYNLFNFSDCDPSDIFCKAKKNDNVDIKKMNSMADFKNKSYPTKNK